MDNELKVTNKTPRAAQTRDKTTRRKPWAPPSSLDAPPAPAGFKHRWIRAETLGQEDNKNLSARLREGFELVRGDAYDAEYKTNKYQRDRKVEYDKLNQFELISDDQWCDRNLLA